MNRAENKATRLIQIENLLLGHPEGLTQAEIARRLQVDRSTITRYISDLPKHIYIEDDGRWKIDRTADLINVRLNLHEGLAVHLASRLLATRMDKQNPHAASALRKLGAAMQRWAPRISRHVQQSADVMDEAAQRHDPLYLQVLERLTLAWAEQRKVRVWHRSETAGRVLEYLFSPYFIEPYAVGQTTYLIGLSEPPGKRRTLKIERIERVELTREAYEIPADFDPRALLADAWGIWYTESEPVEVTLKFHPHVAHRVQETRWHRSEEETELPDGSILWQARISEPQEMLPWIRGWGADVEVLAPESFRKLLEREAGRLARLYKVAAESKQKPIAHIRKIDKDCEDPQYLWMHLTEASALAKQFAGKIGLDKSGEVLGLLHDLGKASKEFQNYLRSAVGILDPDEDGYTDFVAKKGKVDHSSAGAQVIYRHFWGKGTEGRIVAQVLALSIASHHSGLIDCLLPSGEDNFTRRIDKLEENTHVSEALSNLEVSERQIIELLLSDEILVAQLIEKFKALKEENDHKDTLAFKYGLIIRYLFSCVIDADRLNTADFEFPGNSRIRNYGKYHPWGTLVGRLDAKLKTFESKAKKNEVDELRTQVSQACWDFSTKPKGIYQLKVPTGGGKTLSSLRFALNHAKCYDMDRVFYVIPYTSIIDQNADEVRKILEDRDENGQLLDRVVLEHHSNLTPEEETKRQNLLAENWDAPVVFTTQVQFLEALFGSGTRGARRMHQLANSVIIFDEIQTLPIRVIHMFNLAIRFLVNNCGATVVLCTATQPLLDQVKPSERSLPSGQQIIQNEAELFKKLKRVEAIDGRKVGGWTNDEIAERVELELEEKGSVLVIVNTKRSAYSTYRAISERKLTADVYHLSTNMCPAHRLDVLNTVREKLERKEPVICVSTQLIEAGVDVDFGTVIRYLAGLDSIIQAAGRCNRHGRRTSGNLWIVNPQNENIDKLKDIKAGVEKAERILSDYNDNPDMFGNDRLGLAAVEAYFQYYFHDRQNEMMYPVRPETAVGRNDDLFSLLSQNNLSVQANQRITQSPSAIPFKQSFQTASKAFHVIESPTRGVIVPYRVPGEELINELCGVFEIEKQYKLIKKAQRYSVNLLPHELMKMTGIGAIREVQEGSGILYLDSQYYDDQFGWSDEIVNDMKSLIF